MAIPSAGPTPPGGLPNCSWRVLRTTVPIMSICSNRVLVDLVPHTELAARSDLAERLSLLANAPRALVGQLAREDEIAIAGPLLRRSPVIDEKAPDRDCARQGPGSSAGDVGAADRSRPTSPTSSCAAATATWSAARPVNAGALFSDAGYSVLIKRANHDGVLTLAVGQRTDLSELQLKDLLTGSIDIVRRRLLDVVKPDRQVAIRAAISEISGTPEPVESRRNFAQAQRTILALHSAGELNEAALLGFAKSFKYEESIAALSAMSAVKIATLDG